MSPRNQLIQLNSIERRSLSALFTLQACANREMPRPDRRCLSSRQLNCEFITMMHQLKSNGCNFQSECGYGKCGGYMVNTMNMMNMMNAVEYMRPWCLPSSPNSHHTAIYQRVALAKAFYLMNTEGSDPNTCSPLFDWWALLGDCIELAESLCALELNLFTRFALANQIRASNQNVYLATLYLSNERWTGSQRLLVNALRWLCDGSAMALRCHLRLIAIGRTTH